MPCEVHTPPSRLHHSLDLTRERILLAGATKTSDWKHQLIEDFSNYEIDILDPQMNTEWEFEHSSIASQIPLVLDQTIDAGSLPLLGKYSHSGRLVVYCTDNFYLKDHVSYVCDHQGIVFVSSIEELIDTTLVHLSLPRKYRKLLNALT